MELTATIKKVSRETYGDNKTKYTIVLDTTEKQEYPKILAITFAGKSAEKVVEHSLISGTKVKIAYDVESREYNGKYYTEARGYKIESLNASQPTNAAPKQRLDANADLPF
ncbi:MAG: DUF3127 domain-containing protein [Caulobacteraceae bacterium]|nr:DUF3127 domain-containing protein [Caulobacteraceae bacterium]